MDDMKAVGARLGAGEEPVDLDVALTGPLGLVFQHRCERPPAGVADGSSEGMVFHHAFYVQVFNGDDLVLVHEPAGQLVQIVCTSVGYPLVYFCYKQSGLVPGVTALYLARKLLLLALQVLLRFECVPGVVEFGAVAGYDYVRQPRVDAQYLAVERNGRGIQPVFCQYGREVFPGGGLADGNGLYSAGYLAVYYCFDPANLRQGHVTGVYDLDTLRVLNRLPALLAFERGEFGPALEEVDEGAGQVQTYRLQYLAVRFAEPGKRFLELRQTRVQCVLSESLACFFVSPAGFFEAVVPEPSGAAERLGQGFFLFLVRVDAYLGCRFHGFMINYVSANVKDCQRYALYPHG